MKMAELKKKFKDTWVLMVVTKENNLNQVIEAEPIMANKDRDKLHDKLISLPESQKIGKTFATLYTGKATGAILY